MISKEEIENLAELARLKLGTEEKEALQREISSILDYVGQIDKFSAEARATERPLLRNVMREDAPRDVGDSLANKEESIRAQFPKREGDYNMVRKIIQKDE